MPNFLPLVPEEGRKVCSPLAFHKSEEETTPPSSFNPLLPVQNMKNTNSTSTPKKQCKDTQVKIKGDSVLQKSEKREKREEEPLKGCSMLVPVQKDKEVKTGEVLEEKVISRESMDVDCEKKDRGQTDSQGYREKQVPQQAEQKDTKEKQAVNEQTKISHPARAPYSQHPHGLQRRILNATTQSRLPAVEISTPVKSDYRVFGSILPPWGKEKKTSDTVELEEEDDG